MTTEQTFDLVAHLRHQIRFSETTFGPGQRTQGILDHIRQELGEIEAAPTDLEEWIDIVILALDGAWRAGHSPREIAAALAKKQAKNEARTWPDWRTVDTSKAIRHIRTEPEITSPCCLPARQASVFVLEVQRLLDESCDSARYEMKSLRQIGARVAITIGVIDRHNDFLQIYARRDKDGLFLTDDGGTISDLVESGFTPNLGKLQRTLGGFSAYSTWPGAEIQVRFLPDRGNFAQHVNNLARAMHEVTAIALREDGASAQRTPR